MAVCRIAWAWTHARIACARLKLWLPGIGVHGHQTPTRIGRTHTGTGSDLGSVDHRCMLSKPCRIAFKIGTRLTLIIIIFYGKAFSNATA